MAVCGNCGRGAVEVFKFCPECGAPIAPPAPREQRKVVTVVFCDVVGSTALGESLDPEAVRSLLARYFEAMKAIVERHGGSVEKFIGDAVMAVFGVPVLHEDDALRGVRAALEMRDALPGLGVGGRIGVTTGEVVTGSTEVLATGDAVNVAARLEQAAEPGEVLIGAETLLLTGTAVEVEPVTPLALKGKAGAVSAFRLLTVRSEAGRPEQTPMFGRGREKRLLDEALAGVVADRTCRLFTIIGAAGVGKSRLAAEFLAGVNARIVAGRCLSYGDGITYWPVAEVLKQLTARPAEEAAAAAIASLLGESDAPTTPEEIAWAVRKALERAAAERPLVVVFDDIHWGEPLFLDLIEHVAGRGRGAPILLICLTRPELLEHRPEWPVTLNLEPLGEVDLDALLESLGAPAAVRERLSRASAGNPFLLRSSLPGHAREISSRTACR
jgi:class 3 adenylate cyclase